MKQIWGLLQGTLHISWATPSLLPIFIPLSASFVPSSFSLSICFLKSQKKQFAIPWLFHSEIESLPQINTTQIHIHRNCWKDWKKSNRKIVGYTSMVPAPKPETKGCCIIGEDFILNSSWIQDLGQSQEIPETTYQRASQTMIYSSSPYVLFSS